jgi:mitosis inhibitor protein kinase SWE1
MDRSEWMVEQSLMLDEMADQDGEVEAQAQGLGLGLGLGMGLRIPPRLRRDTSGSIESMEDLSGSGASSTSLLSSGRSSGEQQIRPKCVAVWSSVEQDHDEHDPSTPSRQLFSTEAADALQTSSDTAKAGQLFSPLIGKTVSSTTQASPLQHIILSRDVAKTTCPEVNSPTLAKRTKSPLVSFLPRLLSSKKSTSKPRSRPRSPEDVEELTDTEEPESTRRRRTKEALCETPTIRKPDGSVTGGTAARPACSNRARFDDTAMARSLSSESSTEIYASPSRPLSLRASGGKATPAPFVPNPPASLSHTHSKIPVSRRKTMMAVPGQFSAKLSSKVAPPRGSGRPARPFLRRGVTEPTGPSSIDVNLLSAPVQYMHTPPSALFGDVRPSPAAFASTGLIKKKSGITVEIPKFGTASETAAMTKEPTSAISPTSPISPTTVMSGGHGHVGRFVPEKRTSTNSTTGAAGGAGAQKSRGLRRKGSTMFAATGSSGSVVEVCKVFTGSPATPTKPTIQCE